jgi:HK97 family phage major capsid protein
LTSDANTVKVTAASATAITATEVLDLYYALSSNYRNNASWIMAGSTLKALASLAVTVTEGVVHRLVHFPDVPGLPTILGRPVYVSDAMPTIAASHKSVYFGDVASNMLVRRVGSTQVKVLTELYTDSGQVGFRVSRRVDAKIVDPNAGVLLQQAAS